MPCESCRDPIERNLKGRPRRFCVTCRQKRAKDNYVGTVKQWSSRLSHTYGITAIQYWMLLDGQDGGCAICGDGTDLVVDHCHDTGRVRGILCRRDNSVIGLAMEDACRLRSAMHYLEVDRA